MSQWLHVPAGANHEKPVSRKQLRGLSCSLFFCHGLVTSPRVVNRDTRMDQFLSVQSRTTGSRDESVACMSSRTLRAQVQESKQRESKYSVVCIPPNTAVTFAIHPCAVCVCSQSDASAGCTLHCIYIQEPLM